jgi:hypothetical protein
MGAGCAAGWALFSVLGAKAQGPARGRRAPGAMMDSAERIARSAANKPDGQYMYYTPLAPEGMGREYINADVRKPITEYVGASEEFNLGAYFKGETSFEPWDPMGFHLLSRVSANNPDIAWLREAELKHGRICMLAFVGILFTSGNTHLPGDAFTSATEAGWPLALGAINKTNPGIVAQAIATIGLVEGVSNTKRGIAGKLNWWDGLWFGEREGNPVEAGNIYFDPLKLMPNDPKAADKMRLAELKNGRLAMLAVMGIFVGYLNTGKADLF